MSLVGKLEADLELKASALKFLEIFATRTYEVANIYPEFIQSLDIVEGEWGTASGFTVLVNYTVDGKASVSKVMIGDINLVNISITFKLVEGDLTEQFKSFKFITKLTAHELEGSVVHWTLEYEKLNEQIPDPNSFFQEVLQLSKKVDAYITNLL